MNFDSPSNIMKSIFTHPSLSTSKSNRDTAAVICADSPDSPSFLPNHMASKTGKRITRQQQQQQPSALSTKNLNSLVDLVSKDKASYDSPTTTLAADLSENFRIKDLKPNDMTIPTPKRSLKFNNLTGSGGTNKLLDSVTSSNNDFDGDFDQSPLINKTLEAKKPVREKENSRATSISSLNSIASVSSVSSLDSQCDKFPLAMRQPLRRSKTLFSGNPTRNPLSDSGFKSSNAFRTSSVNLLPGFNEDYDSNEESSNEEETQLDELCFASPVPLNRKQMPPPSQCIDDEFSNKMKREIGSPLQKKDTRAKVRRTHSMFHSKKDISDTTQMFGNLMGTPGSPNFFTDNDDANALLSNSILEKSKIGTFNVKNDQLHRINVDELCKILDGEYKEFFDEVIIVDCRFEYEYKGGHIDGAINVSSQQELEKRFLKGYKKSSLVNQTVTQTSSTFGTKAFHPLIIFHCEYSSYRGPSMALHLRSCDRNLNQDNYPHLDFPDVLVLEGGYKEFFEKQPSRCFPQQYVKMDHEKHKEHNERGMKKFRKDFKRASSFNSLTFSSVFQQTRTQSRTLSSRAIQFNPMSSSTNTSSSLFDSGFGANSKPLSLDFINDDDETEGILPSVNLSFKFPLSPSAIPEQPASTFNDFMKEEGKGWDTDEHEEDEGEIIMKKKLLSRSKTLNY